MKICIAKTKSLKGKVQENIKINWKNKAKC